MRLTDKMQIILKHTMTERDNATYCPVRLSTLGVGLTYHAVSAWMLINGSVHLDMGTLGQYVHHMVTLIGVGGATVGAKSMFGGDASPVTWGGSRQHNLPDQL